MIFRTVAEYHNFLVDACRQGRAFAFRVSRNNVRIRGASLVDADEKARAMDPDDLRDLFDDSRRKELADWN